MPYHSNDPTRELTKFYEKVRSYLDELVLEEDDTSKVQSYDDRTFDEPQADELYGLVSKDEFIKILNSYDKQQESQNLREKPVVCDKVIGGNYAKLLFSKPGFHHMGATSHLVKNLEIGNVHRNSFLAGHSTFCPSKDEELAGLKEHQKKVSIKQVTDLAITYINTDQLDLARKNINEALERDPKNCDALEARARYHTVKREFFDAIKNYKLALKYMSHNGDTVKLYLSDTLYQYGMVKFNKQLYKEGLELFDEALIYNSENQGAILHKNLCQDNLKRSTPFSVKPPSYR